MKLINLVLGFCFIMGCTPGVGTDAGVDSGTPAAVEPLTVNNGFLRQDLTLPTVDGDIHTRIVFRANAAFRHDRRIVVMVPGTLANGFEYFDIASGTGYNAAEILASRGYFVVLLDLPGTGTSFHPADGRDANTEMATTAVRRVSRFYRNALNVNKVDVYGETGMGTNVLLSVSDENWVRTVSGSATFYLQYGPGTQVLLSPPYWAFLDSLPTGYLPQDPAQLDLFFGAASPEILVAARTACIGPAPQLIPTGVFYDLRDACAPDSVLTLRLDHPVVDAADGAVPALFIQGSPDFVGSEAGTDELVAEYGSAGGGTATVVTLPGASHLMRFDQVISDGPSSPFWTAELDFLAAN